MQIMSTHEVAELYGVAKKTVIEWVEAGRFNPPPQRLNTGTTGTRSPFVFDRDTVLAQHQRDTAP